MRDSPANKALDMTYTSLQLLLRRHYGGVRIAEDEAIAELNRRGWYRPYRFVFLLLVLPLILPERVCNAIDMGDPWEEANIRALLFSILFSIWSVAPVVCVASFLWALITWTKSGTYSFTIAMYSAGSFVVLSVLFWLSRGKWH